MAIMPQERQFRRLVERGAGQAAAGLGDADRARMVADAPPHLVCPVSKDLLRDAVMLPCCGESASEDAARSALNRTGRCPLCQSSMTADRLVPNRSIRAAVATFIVDWGRLEKDRLTRERDDGAASARARTGAP